MSDMKTVVIVGGVAGGASAAARLRRLNDDIDVIVLERSGYVSFANCGLPYHLSSTIEDRDDLLLATPESLHARFRLDVRVNTEVGSIDPDRQVVHARNLATGTTYELDYDALVLSPGATPIVPDIPGAERGLSLRDVEDLDRMITGVAQARDIVVVGGGFIGLETAENLRLRGLNVTIIELADQLLAPLDPEMAGPVLHEVRRHGINVELGVAVTAITPDAVALSDGRTVPADAVIFAIGVRPDATLARAARLSVGGLGGIVVDAHMRTSDPHIWAVGDAVEKTDLLDATAALTPLANLANRHGRRAADSIMGLAPEVPHSQGTAIVKVFDLAAATTGWNEKRLRAAGRDFLAIHTHPTAHAAYYPGAESLALKLLINPNDGRILGAQAVGYSGVDKRIDVLATALRAGMRGCDLADLELAYAPPFGSAKDPINILGYIAEDRRRGAPSLDWSQMAEQMAAGWRILDVRTHDEFAGGSVPGSVNIPLDELREHVEQVRGGRWIALCGQGQRAHVAVSYLTARGIQATNLDGGWLTLSASPAGQAVVSVSSAASA